MADRVEIIGIYSAYGFAKEAGYTGTKAEFEQGLKNSAEYADNAASSANAATNAKNAAVTAKTDAQAAQSAAETAQGLAEDAQAAAEEAKNDAEAAAASLDASTIARIDGFYENMGVGTADQLMASQKVHNSDSYIFRTSGGTSDIGNREELEIVGGSIVWNQKCAAIADTNTIERYGVTYSWLNNKCTISGGPIDAGYTYVEIIPNGLNIGVIAGHKYLAFFINNASYDYTVDKGGFYCVFSGGNVPYNEPHNPVQYRFMEATGTGNLNIYYRVHPKEEFSATVYAPQLFDLTAMFGSEIADHIYSLEQAEEGAGVAWFRKYFPNEYYDYNPGELMHVSDLQSHDMVGFNLFDKTNPNIVAGKYITNTGDLWSGANYNVTGYIGVVPSMQYYLHPTEGSNPSVAFYTADKKFISAVKYSDATSKLVTAPSNAHYLRASYNKNNENAFCVNLSWSGTRDGEYEPYVKHSYPLDSSLTLRGIPKLTTDGDLTYDGDIYKPDGTVERRYGIVDLGTLTSWGNNMAGKNAVEVTVSLPEKAFGRTNIFCDKLVVGAGTAIDTAVLSVCGFLNSRGIAVKVPKTLATTTQEAVDWIQSNHPILVYELAEPTTEEAEPYTSSQIVDDWGTEEFVTTSIVPVGHNTSYPANLRDKLQHLPDLPDNDGYYMTQVTGTQMSLIRFRIPQAPAEDGEYILKATVSNGTPTYTWEAVVEAEGGEG